ncbi:putative proteasome activator subunit 4 [Myxozyma melibiosi]|uniref:Proteasome activator subunit 4 n=1 Tax=Myxozyma melibiosi TaxID=54550 RepID=A0ABR1FBA6_9ASCO
MEDSLLATVAPVSSPTLPFSRARSPSSDPDIRKPRTFPYTSLLPFPVESDDVPLQHLNHIVESIYVSMTVETAAVAPLVHWTRELRSWLQLKFDMPISTRTRLAAVYYELALVQGVALSSSDTFSRMFITLAQKRSFVDRSKLTLDWRPLFREMKAIAFPDLLVGSIRDSEKDMAMLSKVAIFARRFFAPDATLEILDELLPLFNTSDPSAALQVATIFDALIPTEFTPEDRPDLYPQQWLPVLFHLWTLNPRSQSYDLIIIDILSRVASGHLIEAHIPFSAIGIYTKEQTAVMLTCALRLFEIPIGRAGSPYVNTEGYPQGYEAKKSRAARPLARWIIYSLSPYCLGELPDRSDCSSALRGLQGLIQSVETFFHPSNSGVWTKHLAQFVQSLTDFFVLRWHREQSGELSTPEDRRLSPELKREFVLTLKDVVLMGIYAKSATAAMYCQAALQNLAVLEPDIILPVVLAQSYASLQGLVETHRTITSLKTLTLLSQTIIQNKPFRTHVTALLGLALPGIDANDLTKTVQSLAFIQSVASYVPFADLSEGCGSALAMEYITGAIESLENDSSTLPPLGDEDEIAVLKSSTATFGEFMLSFMGRIFSLLENLPDASSSNSRAAPEQNAVNMLPATFTVVLGALSDELFDLILDKFITFVTNHIIPQAADAISNLLSCLCKTHPERTFHKLFPVLVGNIREEIDENQAGQSKSQDVAPKDRSLVWYLSMFRKAVWTAGDVLLNYSDELLDLLVYLRERTYGAASVHSSFLVHHTIYALTNVYHSDSRLLNEEEYSAKGGFTVEDWGKQTDPSTGLKLKWHVPTDDQVTLAVRVYEDGAEYSMSEIRRLMEGGPKLQQDWSEEIAKQLGYLRMIISGASVLYDPAQVSASGASAEVSIEEDDNSGDVEMTDSGEYISEEDDLELGAEAEMEEEEDEDDEEALSIKKLFTYPIGYFFEDKKDDPRYIKVHEIHEKLGWLIHDLHTYLQKNKEDEVTAIRNLATVTRVWFIDIGCEHSLKLLDTYVRSYIVDTRNYKISGRRKQYPRYLLARRAHIYHLQRVKHNSGPRKTSQLDKVLLLDLVQSSLSRYTKNRRQSQQALQAAIRTVMKSRILLAPKLIEELNNAVAAKEYDCAKGAMHTLYLDGIRRFVSRDPRVFPDYGIALLAAAKADKLSIHDLARNLILQFALTTRMTPKKLYYSDDYEKFVSQIKPERDLSARLGFANTRNLKRAEDTRAKIDVLEAELMKLQKAETHWRITFMISTMLTGGLSLLRENEPAELGVIFFKGAIDNHPYIRFSFVQGALKLFTSVIGKALVGYDVRKLLQGDFKDVGVITVPVDQDDPDFSAKFIEQFKSPEADYFVRDLDRPGWLVWGKSFTAEANPKPGLDLQFKDSDRETMRAIGETVDRAWFEKFCEILLEEPSRTEHDVFRSIYAMFAAIVYAIVHEGFAKLTFEDMVEIIHNLYGDGKDKNHHRATAELIGGLLSEPLSREFQLKAIEVALPVLDKVVEDGLTPETVGYWTGCISFFSASVDPRAIWPILTKLASVRIDASSNAAFKESSRISLLRRLIAKEAWSFQIEEPIMKDFLAHLDHDYKGVREEIGRTLGTISRSRYSESFRSVKILLEENRAAGPLGVIPFVPDEARRELIEGVFKQLAIWRQERAPLQETSSYTNGGKTVMIWFNTWLQSCSCPELLPFFPKLILPELLNLLDIKEDAEVISLAVTMFKNFGNVPWPSNLIKDMIDGIIEIASKSSTWHQRLRVLALAQVFYFRQLFKLSNLDRRRLFDCVSDLLSDPQLEVRDTAATTLSGMIRCSPARFRGLVITKLQKKFTKALQDNPMPGRPGRGSGDTSRSGSVQPLKSSSAGPASAFSSRPSTPSVEYNNIILTRHAAVLGLSALVQAFPYQSPPPEWMPSVLATLANKAANDPGMVGRSVKTALGEFKKTRQDTWHVDVKVFDKEQLEDLEGVLWRTYFA